MMTAKIHGGTGLKSRESRRIPARFQIVITLNGIAATELQLALLIFWAEWYKSH
jgi:hypothetical protein